jgi:hypothetical protein
MTLIRGIDIGVKGTNNADKGIDIAAESRCTYDADAAPSVVPSWPNVNEVSKSSVCTGPCAPTLDRSPKHAAAQLRAAVKHSCARSAWLHVSDAIPRCEPKW